MNVCQLLAVCMLWGAADASGAAGTAEDLLAAPHWEIAPEISVFQYHEPGMMKEKGILYGLAGAYTHEHGRDLIRIEGEFALGTMDYEGALPDGTPYRMDDCHDYLLNLRLLWGRQWAAPGCTSRFHGRPRLV